MNAAFDAFDLRGMALADERSQRAYLCERWNRCVSAAELAAHRATDCEVTLESERLHVGMQTQSVSFVWNVLCQTHDPLKLADALEAAAAELRKAVQP
jgi:hypothetical protein